MADCSDELPGTFPVLHSQHSPAVDPVVWGCLLSRTPRYSAIDLTSDEVTFGRRSNCTVTFDGKKKKQFPFFLNLKASIFQFDSLFFFSFVLIQFF